MICQEHQNQPFANNLYKAYGYYGVEEKPICIGHFENPEDSLSFFGLGFSEISVYFGGKFIQSFVR